MTAPVLIGIGLLGGAGALVRFLLDGAVSERWRGSFPAGTLAVNLSGAFALGIVTGATLHGDALRLVATGLIGSYTTFSTWMLESHRLGEDGALSIAALNIALSLVAGVAAVAIGRAVA
ncbi:MAG TPA: fluoride efflux transporter CrcB [Solirubrobacteraceae bacterium]|nr:fluoride efflux transporter CrcB [Solirubrobacteraceae bacterium]